MRGKQEKIVKIPRVGKIKIRNCGVIKDANIEFKNGLNIITGENASGKSTVVRFLINKFNPEKLSYAKKVMLQIDSILDGQTIIMDDILSCLDRENLIKTLNRLSNSERQVILTLNKRILSGIKDKIGANIIDTKNFKLKT